MSAIPKDHGAVRPRLVAIAICVGIPLLCAGLVTPVTGEGARETEADVAELGPMGGSIYGEIHIIWVDCHLGEPLTWSWISDRPVDFAVYDPDGQLVCGSLNVTFASGTEVASTNGKHMMTWLNRSPTTGTEVRYIVEHSPPDDTGQPPDDAVDWPGDVDNASWSRMLAAVLVALLLLLGGVLTKAARMGVLHRPTRHATERQVLSDLKGAYATISRVEGPVQTVCDAAGKGAEGGMDAGARIPDGRVR